MSQDRVIDSWKRGKRQFLYAFFHSLPADVISFLHALERAVFIFLCYHAFETLYVC